MQLCLLTVPTQAFFPTPPHPTPPTHTILLHPSYCSLMPGVGCCLCCWKALRMYSRKMYFNFALKDMLPLIPMKNITLSHKCWNGLQSPPRFSVSRSARKAATQHATSLREGGRGGDGGRDVCAIHVRPRNVSVALQQIVTEQLLLECGRGKRVPAVLEVLQAQHSYSIFSSKMFHNV